MALDLHIGLWPENASYNEPVESFEFQEFNALTKALNDYSSDGFLITRLSDYYADSMIAYSETPLAIKEINELMKQVEVVTVKNALSKLSQACEYAKNHNMNLYFFCD